MSTQELNAALRRFLGVGADADDASLLDLNERQIVIPAAIDAAARKRVDQIRRHPGGTGPDAELAAARVGLAASRLRGRIAERSRGEAPSTPPATVDDSAARATPGAGSASAPPPISHRAPTAKRATPAPPDSSPPTATPSPPAPTPSSSAPAPLELEPDDPSDVASSWSATPSRDVSPRADHTEDRAEDRMPPSAIQMRRMEAIRRTSDARRTQDGRPTLTPFDRAVLGTLVGHGGWNRRSRARLVALAAANGVGPRGLMNVIRGLTEYANSGGGRAGVDEIAPDFAMIAGGRVAGVVAAGPGPSAIATAADDAAELAKRLLPEIERSGVWPVVKLSAIVLLVMALLAIPIVRGLTSGNDVTELDPGSSATAIGPTAGNETGRSGRAGSSSRNASSADESSIDRLVFVRIPMIEGPPPAPGLLDAADAMSGLPDLIAADVTRRLEVGAAPTDATFQRWSALMLDAERGWTRAAPSDVRAVRRAAASAFVAAGDRADVAERLADALRPPVGFVSGEPTVDGVPGPWAGAWRVSVLAAVAADPFAPAAVREACGDVLDAVVSFPGAPGTGGFDARPEAGPRQVAAAWLDLAAAEMITALGPEPGVDIETTDAASEAWERWLEAAEALDAASSVATIKPRLVVAALESLIASELDVERGELASRLLGRLVSELPAAVPPSALDFIRRAHSRSQIATTSDLRALGSVFALRRDLPWFRPELVVPEGASDPTRIRFLERIVAAWPETSVGPAAGRPLAVGAAALVTWRELLDAVESVPAPLSPTADLLAAARLGELAEAAHLLAAGRDREANAIASALGEELVRPPDDSEDVPARPTRIEGLAEPDGAWTRSWDATRGRGEAAVARVRALRTESANDLGPIDARTFVTVATRTGARRVRETAQAILLEKYGEGTNVILELLDALPTARVDRGFRETIHRLTGVTMPADDDARWRSLARAALLEYATSVVGRDGDVVGRLERRLAETLDRRAAVLERRRIAASSVASSAAAAAVLADAWLAAADARVAVRPVPATATELRRRRIIRERLATDSVQAAISGLVTSAEGLAFVVAAEQPAQAEACLRVLDVARVERDRASTATAQWLAVERAIIDLWRIRFGLVVDSGDRS